MWLLEMSQKYKLKVIAMSDLELYNLAWNAKSMSYSPYSKFRVGAAVIAENNEVYSGANIENSSYGATVCAERTAVFKAIIEGNRKIKTVAIASDTDATIFPCGICRQVLGEFCDEDAKIICGNSVDSFEIYTLGELMPKRFRI